MTGMIFSAGLGTRFKPWTDKHPKALAMVNGKTLLEWNIRYLQKFGIRDVIVNVHHFSQQVIDAIESNHGWGSRVLISDESEELLETGGGLLKAKTLFPENQPFITCNVDILTELDINKLVAFGKQQHALCCFAVTSRQTSRYLLFDENSRLCGWRNTLTGKEKIVRGSDVLIQKAYSCVVLFDYSIFSLMEKAGFKGKFSLIDVYLALAAEHTILGYDHTGDRLVDVGKPEAVAEAEKLFSA
jgi:N-acetyl-alpha-D-muramate 1-phosphate uridylyltransferase